MIPPTPPASAAKPPEPSYSELDILLIAAQQSLDERQHPAMSYLEKELKRSADMLSAVAGDIEDGYSLDSLRCKYLQAIVNARDAARAALAREGERRE